MGNSNGRPPSQVQSVDRAISVLEHLAQHGECGLTEIAAKLGVHKSTVSRLVGALEARGLVEQHGERGKFSIGFGIIRLAGRVTDQRDLTRFGSLICEDLAEKVGETVNIAVLDGDAAINICQARGDAAVVAQNWVGRRTPWYATSSGKVLVSVLPTDRWQSLLEQPRETFTPMTIDSTDDLRSALERVQQTGFAACFEEFEFGLNSVGVPVYGPNHVALAAISASGPAYRLTRTRISDIVNVLRRGADDLSAQLGYVGASSVGP